MRTLIVGAALVAVFLASPSFGAVASPVTVEEAAALTPGAYLWRDGGETGPVSIVVSLPDQRAYVYRAGTLVAVGAVSTGREGRETPIGSYPVLQKQVAHKSSLYDDAAMPYMQRLTWDGVAIHAGGTPGFPSSHGCVHVSVAFARKLFAITRIGTQVTVIDASVDGAPADTAPPAPATIATQAETASANAGQLATLASR